MDKKFSVVLLITLLAFFLAGCGPNSDEIANQLVTAINSRDIETSLSLFSDNASIRIGDLQHLEGKEEVQSWLEKSALLNLTITIESMQNDGDTVVAEAAMTSDYWRYVDANPMEGTIRLTIQDGLVNNFTVTFDEVSMNKLLDPSVATTDSLIGVWTTVTMEAGTVPGVPEQWFIRFHDDSKIRWADSPESTSSPVDEAYPGAWLTWSYDGAILSVQNDGQASEHYCQVEDMGFYMVKHKFDEDTNNIQLAFKSVKDPCAFRMVNLPRYGAPWDQFTP